MIVRKYYKKSVLMILIILISSFTASSQVVINKKEKKSGKFDKSLINISEIEQKIFDLLNEKRIKKNLKPLKWNETLVKVSRNHSSDMKSNKFFGLKGSKGKDIKQQAYDAEITNWKNFGRMIASTDDTKEVETKIIERWTATKARQDYLLNAVWVQGSVGLFVSDEGQFYITLDLLGN